MPILEIRGDLYRSGANFDAVIVPSAAVAAKLKEEKKPLPSKQSIAQIDTGATSTCIDTSIVNELGLISRNQEPVSIAGDIVLRPFYDCAIILPVAEKLALSVQAIEFDFSREAFDILIGRDILRTCHFFYNGHQNNCYLYF